MSIGDILVYAGLGGLALSAILIPVSIIVLHRKERKITRSVREEYEI